MNKLENQKIYYLEEQEWDFQIKKLYLKFMKKYFK